MKRNHYEYPPYIDEFGETTLPVHSARILPSLFNPTYTTAEKNTQTRDNDDVLGITFNGISRAYPTWIMDNYHNVNDMFGDAPLLIIH